jgi:hypothetical protein
MGAREMGNFIAGFGAGAYDSNFTDPLGVAEVLTVAGGIYYANQDPDESNTDAESRPFIRSGVDAGRAFQRTEQDTTGLRLPPAASGHQPRERSQSSPSNTYDLCSSHPGAC